MADTTQLFQRRCRHCGTVIAPGLKFCSHCGAAAEPLAAGDPLLDDVRALFGRDLEIERELGRGGMAVVYAAFDPALQRRVAVKVLLPEIADTDLDERFRREARMVAALQHPNVVSVYAVRTSDTLSAIVMQFVEGRSLDVALEGEPRLALPVAGLILSQVADALQHAHERGIVHRDVKPANVLLGDHGRAVVSDFGIARREGNAKLTGTGVIMGTIAYMSPEQCTGTNITAASDQYSFGIMAYELLAGHRPFSGSVATVLNAHLTDTPRPLAELRPELPRAVTDYVMTALAKEPEARHRDLTKASEVFGALVRDTTAASTVVAAMSKVAPRPRGASVVTEAVTVLAPATSPNPPATVATPLAPPTAAAVAASAPARAPSSTRGLLIGMGLGGAALAAFFAWRAMSRAPAAQARATATLAGGATQTPSSATPPGGVVTAASGVPLPNNASHTGRASSPQPNAAPGAGTPSVTTADAGSRGAAPDVTPSRDSAPASPPPSPAPAPVTAAPPAAAPAVTATLADARAAAREFVTWFNQRRAGDVEALGSLEGDAALRAEIVKLVRSAPDFAAGFDRVASTPRMVGDRLLTDFVVDLQWRGGHRLAVVRLQGALQNGAWHPAAFGVSPAE